MKEHFKIGLSGSSEVLVMLCTGLPPKGTNDVASNFNNIMMYIITYEVTARNFFWKVQPIYCYRMQNFNANKKNKTKKWNCNANKCICFQESVLHTLNISLYSSKRLLRVQRTMYFSSGSAEKWQEKRGGSTQFTMQILWGPTLLTANESQLWDRLNR